MFWQLFWEYKVGIPSETIEFFLYWMLIIMIIIKATPLQIFRHIQITARPIPSGKFMQTNHFNSTLKALDYLYSNDKARSRTDRIPLKYSPLFRRWTDDFQNRVDAVQTRWQTHVTRRNLRHLPLDFWESVKLAISLKINPSYPYYEVLSDLIPARVFSSREGTLPRTILADYSRLFVSSVFQKIWQYDGVRPVNTSL